MQVILITRTLRTMAFKKQALSKKNTLENTNGKQEISLMIHWITIQFHSTAVSMLLLNRKNFGDIRRIYYLQEMCSIFFSLT